MAKKRQGISATEFMNQKIQYGGEIRTRASVARELKTEGFPEKAIGIFAYNVPEYKPENTRAKQYADQPRRRKRTYGYKVGRKNEYNVSTYLRAKNTTGRHSKVQNANAWGEDGVRSAKTTGQGLAHGRAVKNVVYNRTRKRYVGPNRPER